MSLNITDKGHVDYFCVKLTLITAFKSRISSFSKKERLLFSVLTLVILFGIIGFLHSMSSHFAIAVPTHGGTIREGILGTPRFINPVLASSDIDLDLSALVYSGLMRRIPGNDSAAELVPDLAESYTVSDDGKIYTFILKENLKFHDGKPLTAADIAFTIKTITDPQFQSPLMESWIGVTTEAIDDRTIKIILPRAFSGFLDIATVGILPQHIWGMLSVDEFLASSYNTVPVGSGPYKMRSIARNSNGIAKQYNLKSFKRFALGNPNVEKLKIDLYPNEQSLTYGYTRGDFNLLANMHPYEITGDVTNYTVTNSLPRMFGLFLNNTNEIFRDTQLRSIITKAIDVPEIIDTVFQGYATPISNPIPGLTQESPINPAATDELNQKLESLGWKLNTDTGIRQKGGKNLSFSISTADTAELKYTAQTIQRQLQKIGVKTELQIFQLNDLENSVIKKRSFDALLFGQVIRNDADLYAFWHSSQKNAGGLNITGYSTTMLDNSIEKLLATNDRAARQVILKQITSELKNAPVIWLYQPDFIYAMRRPVYGINLSHIIGKHDRFATIYDWYIKTDTVWKFLQKNK